MNAASATAARSDRSATPSTGAFAANSPTYTLGHERLYASYAEVRSARSSGVR